MSDELEVLEEWAGALLAKLEPGERRKLLGQVARGPRRNQQRRIAAQRALDGTAYAPRNRARGGLRAKRGRIRSQMFVKLRTARWMRTEVSAAGVAVGFVGRVGRIAYAHQHGRNEMNKQIPVSGYSRRLLLGLKHEDRKIILDLILQPLTTCWLYSTSHHARCLPKHKFEHLQQPFTNLTKNRILRPNCSINNPTWKYCLWPLLQTYLGLWIKWIVKAWQGFLQNT